MNNTSFELHHPTRIVFGAGTRHRIGDLVAPLGTTVALLPGDAPSLEPLLREIVADLARAEVTVVPVEPVASNPRIDEINRRAAAIRGRGVQGVVAFGGGSTMDAGKALAVMLSAGIDDLAPLFHSGRKIERHGIFVTCLPTTSGTGSEVSRGAILTDVKEHVKRGLRGDGLTPTLAILDPEVTYGLPWSLTRTTGFDAFTHAFESFLSRKRTRFSLMVSREAMRLVLAVCPYCGMTANRSCRANMMFASLLGGLNLYYVGTALPHRLQYPLGAHTDTAHADGLAALYPGWLELSPPRRSSSWRDCSTCSVRATQRRSDAEFSTSSRHFTSSFRDLPNRSTKNRSGDSRRKSRETSRPIPRTSPELWNGSTPA